MEGHPAIRWDIRREGHPWPGDGVIPRLDLLPEKFEVWDGKPYWREEDRVNLLAMMLEVVGVDRAVRLGDPRVWRAAIAALDRGEGGRVGDAQGDAP